MIAFGIALVGLGAMLTVPVGMAIRGGRTVSTFGALWLALSLELMIVGLFIVGWQSFG